MNCIYHQYFNELLVVFLYRLVQRCSGKNICFNAVWLSNDELKDSVLAFIWHSSMESKVACGFVHFAETDCGPSWGWRYQWRNQPRFYKSNFLGFQSRRCLLKDSPYFDHAERQALVEMLCSILPLSCIFKIISSINCSPPGSHNSAHVHAGAEISGVLYISVPSDSGIIVFRDPRPQAEMSQLNARFGQSISSLNPRFELSPE